MRQKILYCHTSPDSGVLTQVDNSIFFFFCYGATNSSEIVRIVPQKIQN